LQQEISAMRDGLYRADFRTQRGSGSGVVHVQNGKLWGGDAQMYYVGSYSVVGRRVTAQVTASRHTQRAVDASVFGLDKVTLTLDGTVHGDAVRWTGTAAEVPGADFGAELIRLSD
jgi:hypothetical protein